MTTTDRAGDRAYPAMHMLKCWPEYFGAVLDGSKTFEVRKDDRGFQVGDNLCLNEWDPKTERYTTRSVERWVTYVLRDGPFAIPGHVIMGIRDTRSDGGVAVTMEKRIDAAMANKACSDDLARTNRSSDERPRDGGGAGEVITPEMVTLAGKLWKLLSANVAAQPQPQADDAVVAMRKVLERIVTINEESSDDKVDLLSRRDVATSIARAALAARAGT
jgi:hypothetical protein